MKIISASAHLFLSHLVLICIWHCCTHTNGIILFGSFYGLLRMIKILGFLHFLISYRHFRHLISSYNPSKYLHSCCWDRILSGTILSSSCLLCYGWLHQGFWATYYVMHQLLALDPGLFHYPSTSLSESTSSSASAGHVLVNLHLDVLQVVHGWYYPFAASSWYFKLFY